MIDITKKLPISLIKLLNSFNEKLISYRKKMELVATSNELNINGNKFESIKSRYNFKNSDFFFEINFVIDMDFIDWSYYPNNKDSSKINNQKRIEFSQEKCDLLKVDLEKWQKNISEVNSLLDPLDFFSQDKIIEFYSNEIIEEIPYNDYEEVFPLNSDKQDLALLLIEKQEEFLDIELNEIEDQTSEKYIDLNTAKTNLIELKENMSHMTISEVKKKWSLSFGVILKWSKKKFLQFINIDKTAGHDISRMIGSFIGGVFGIPKVEQ